MITKSGIFKTQFTKSGLKKFFGAAHPAHPALAPVGVCRKMLIYRDMIFQ